MTCRNPTEIPLFSLLLAARSRNHVEFHGWSARSPRARPGQRELCSLETAPWDAGMNIGWKSSKQAINYRRRESSPALGSFRNMVHTISDCWGRRGLLMTHTKKNPPGISVLDKTQGLSRKWLSQLAGGAQGADSPSASWPFFRSHPSGAELRWDFLSLTVSGSFGHRTGCPPVAFQGNWGERRRCLWPPGV